MKKPPDVLVIDKNKPVDHRITELEKRVAELTALVLELSKQVKKIADKTYLT